MISRLLSLCLAGSLFAGVSCIPLQRVPFEIAATPEYSFPEATEKILVFNTAYLPEATGLLNPLFYKLEPGERFILDTIVNRNLMSGFFSIADDTPGFFQPVLDYHEYRSSDTTAFLKPLSGESVKELCVEFDADMLVAFEFYGFENKYSSTASEDYEVFQVIQRLERAFLWRVYSPENGMEKQVFQQDTLYWSGEGSSYREAFDALPIITDVLREAAFLGGTDFARRIVPYWQPVSRKYFLMSDITGANVSLDSMALKEFVGYGSRTKAYKALYNLAVINEMNGDIEQAINYINDALVLRSDAYEAKNYKEELLKRRRKE
jgi:hypothetical protein